MGADAVRANVVEAAAGAALAQRRRHDNDGLGRHFVGYLKCVALKGYIILYVTPIQFF